MIFSIIHNGVDLNKFPFTQKTLQKNNSPIQLISCSWSPNPNKGHSLISNFSMIEGVKVTFIGNWPDSISKQKVNVLSVTTHEEIANYYSNSHIFLFPSSHEACSNTLIEALSSGLPTLYLDSGSNSEIASEYGVPIDLTDIRTSLKKITKFYSQFVERIKLNRQNFSIENSARQYASTFSKITNCDKSNS